MLGAQGAGSFSAHPLLLNRSLRGVGFLRPGPNFGSCSKLGYAAAYDFVPPLDFIWLEDGTVLGDEVYGDPIGIG